MGLQEMLDERRALTTVPAFGVEDDPGSARCLRALDDLLSRADVAAFPSLYRDLGLRAAVLGIALLLDSAAPDPHKADAEILAAYGVLGLTGRLRAARPPAPDEFIEADRVVNFAIAAATNVKTVRAASSSDSNSSAIRNSNWEAAIAGLAACPELGGAALSKATVGRRIARLGPPPQALFQLGRDSGMPGYRESLANWIEVPPKRQTKT